MFLDMYQLIIIFLTVNEILMAYNIYVMKKQLDSINISIEHLINHIDHKGK